MVILKCGNSTVKLGRKTAKKIYSAFAHYKKIHSVLFLCQKNIRKGEQSKKGKLERWENK